MADERTPSRPTIRDVYGTGIMADIADFFLVDEPSDLLNLVPPIAGAPARGASIASGVIREAASPSANMARKLFRGENALDDATVWKSIFQKLSRGFEDVVRPASPVGKLDPRNPAEIADVLKRRAIDSTVKDNFVRMTGGAVVGDEETQGMMSDFMQFVQEEIERERQRTGGQGLF